MSKILIIEDDKIISNMYKTYLKDFDIDFCEYIEDAQKLIGEKGKDNWDVYVCDLKVPYNKYEIKSNKFNTFDIIIGNLDPCKTIIVSGYLSPEIKDMVLEMNVFSIFTKPIDMKILRIAINSIMKCYGK